jgi:membrane peptidoglycan carboxypeptidase
MAEAYATLAAHGIACPPHFATSAVDQSGAKIPLTQGSCHRALPVEVADTETAILEGVLTNGTGSGKGLADRVAAGKTGTTDNQAAAWFVGFTPQLAMAVGMGDPKNPSEAMRCVDVGTGVPGHTVPYCGGVFGGTFPAQIWHDAMTAALVGKPVLAMPYAGEVDSVGNTATLPDLKGLTLDQANALLAKVGLTAVAALKPIPADAPNGTIVKETLGGQAGAGPPPALAGGAVAGPGTVIVTLSAGKPKPSPSPTPSASAASAAAPPPGAPVTTVPAAPGVSPVAPAAPVATTP